MAYSSPSPDDHAATLARVRTLALRAMLEGSGLAVESAAAQPPTAPPSFQWPWSMADRLTLAMDRVMARLGGWPASLKAVRQGGGNYAPLPPPPPDADC